MPVGRGAWVIDIADDQFTAAASGTTAGLMRVFASGQGQSASRGAVAGGQLVPSTYRVEHRHRQEVRRSPHGAQLRRREGIRRRAAERPEPGARAADRGASARRRRSDDRLADARAGQRRHVRAAGLPAQRSRSSTAACATICSSPSSASTRVKAEKGYQGTVVVCSVVFAPIAGHIPERAAIKYLVELRDIEVWLAPIAGTRRDGAVPGLGPDAGRASGVLQATQFVSIPQPAAARRQDPVTDSRQRALAATRPGDATFDRAIGPDAIRLRVNGSSAIDGQCGPRSTRSWGTRARWRQMWP